MSLETLGDDIRGFLAAIVDSSDDAIIGKDLDGVITSWNPGAQKLYGYLPEEVIGRSISVLVPSGQSDEIPAILARLRRGERIAHYETRRVTKDGRTLDVSVTISPIKNSRGEVVGASAIARDVTQRKEAELLARRALELEASNRSMRDFVAMAAHDLRTPISVIEGLAMVLSERLEGPRGDELRNHLTVIQRQARNLSRLVNDLLIASRLEAGAVHAERVVFDVEPLMEEVIADFLEEFEGASPALSVDGGATVFADRDHVRRILVNLLSNAKRYGSPPYAVRVRRTGDWVELLVADRGQGVAPDFAPRLFDRFAREGASHDRSGGGTGLGLTIVRGLARA
ncbi:MAG TPA: PAS domain S-box protein, partial [Actinomycetota bacterium]|nr:PAS domain S-box protein [Actinomycetota bacterium]